MINEKALIEALSKNSIFEKVTVGEETVFDIIERLTKYEKTEKYNRMIEAFECDFALIEQGKMTFAELDRLLKDKSYSLVTDMDLMQELSYLLRHGKAEIYVRGNRYGEINSGR